MISCRILSEGLMLLGLAAFVSGYTLGAPVAKSDCLGEELDDALSKSKRDTLRLVTVVMRHGERAPADTYPNDPYVKSTMKPYGWGQLTNKGRVNVYRTGQYLRKRYDRFLGRDYHPDKYWLQTSSIDRTKMTGLILSAALWKPTEKQAFLADIDWQPVSLHYWNRLQDRLLIIWDACPLLTFERIQVENASEVRRLNNDNEELYRELTNLTGLPINNAADVASLYGTLKAEAAMDLLLPEWTKEYFPERLGPIACFSLSMNVFNDKLRKLAGGPLVTKIVRTMKAKSLGRLKPMSRKMYVYVGHDSTIVNMLSAMGVWNGHDPNYGCTIMIELHENNGRYNVQIFQKDSVDEEPYSLRVPGCATVCPLQEFERLMEPVINGDYEKECKVDDPNYVIPPQPAA